MVFHYISLHTVYMQRRVEKKELSHVMGPTHRRHHHGDDHVTPTLLLHYYNRDGFETVIFCIHAGNSCEICHDIQVMHIS